MSKAVIYTKIETLWEDYLPEPLQATKWAIGELDDDIDNVRLYFEDDQGRFVQVDLVGVTRRGETKSSEFADDLYSVTGYRPE